jgi:hypothetical protein
MGKKIFVYTIYHQTESITHLALISSRISTTEEMKAAAPYDFPTT